jgi:hypothetical protein
MKSEDSAQHAGTVHRFILLQQLEKEGFYRDGERYP